MSADDDARTGAERLLAAFRAHGLPPVYGFVNGKKADEFDLPKDFAFAVATSVDSDILIVDEVLAVGDLAFQRKCFDSFHQMRADGKTIVFVSHDLGSVREFCDRALLLERGIIRKLGPAEDVVAAYVGDA